MTGQCSKHVGGCWCFAVEKSLSRRLVKIDFAEEALGRRVLGTCWKVLELFCSETFGSFSLVLFMKEGRPWSIL